MEVISEDSINKWIVPQLSVAKRGSKPSEKPAAIVSAILYRLKTSGLKQRHCTGWHCICLLLPYSLSGEIIESKNSKQVLCNNSSYGQNATSKHLPIIDVHVHAMKVNPAFTQDLCPWFLSNMPGADPNGPPPSFTNTDCAQPLKAAKSDQEFQEALIETMKRLNMTIIASGDAGIICKWQKAAPAGRVIPSI